MIDQQVAQALKRLREFINRCAGQHLRAMKKTTDLPTRKESS
jgi:hypothetical protein